MYCPEILSSADFGFEKTRKQRRCETVRVYILRKCMRISSGTKFVFLKSFLSVNHSKCNANITSENFFRISTERCSTRCFLLMLLRSFSRFSRHLGFDTTSDVNVSLWNDCVFGLDFIESGRVKTWLHMV